MAFFYPRTYRSLMVIGRFMLPLWIGFAFPHAMTFPTFYLIVCMLYECYVNRLRNVYVALYGLPPSLPVGRTLSWSHDGYLLRDNYLAFLLDADSHASGYSTWLRLPQLQPRKKSER